MKRQLPLEVFSSELMAYLKNRAFQRRAVQQQDKNPVPLWAHYKIVGLFIGALFNSRIKKSGSFVGPLYNSGTLYSADDCLTGLQYSGFGLTVVCVG